eukprot:XP_015572778.2 probable LRR receptor-like serine/threonine-protein kinase At1g05700 isoform X1 [Ricinus communis]
MMVVKSKGIRACSSFMRFILLVVVYAICLETNVMASGSSRFRNSEAKSIVQMHTRRKLDDIAGSINIDCGLSEDSSSTEVKTGMHYISDTLYTNTGVNKKISSNFSSDAQFPVSLMTVRSFSQGIRNCYTLRPPEGKASIYLIRASFMYGNYDNLNQLPQFSLYLGVNLWDTVKFDNASHVVIKEIIHVPALNDIYVCLLNTGSGTPFISALELRHFHNSTYRTESGSLVLFQRLDFGSTTNEIVRYHDDAYDRIWFPYNCPQYAALSTSFAVDSLKTTDFNLPSKVMQTAVEPMNANESLNFEFDIGTPNMNFYIYMHFAEVESIQRNQYRGFNIALNGKLFNEGVVLKYLQSMTISTMQPMRGAKISISLNKLPNSTLPPILNAMEIYLMNEFWQQPTYQEDANSIEDIMSSYNVGKGWQGDPCLPAPAWDGLNCSDNGYDPPRIISLNLSSIGITGQISSSLSNLKFLQHLDLSNNSLTGAVPEFLSQLPDLKILNLGGNRLSGSIPSALMEKSNNQSLLLRLDGNPELCLLSTCEKEKKSVFVPIVATVVPLAAIFLALIILWRYKRRKVPRRSVNSQKEEGSSLKSDKRQFTYAKIVRITNNFSTVIGKGGFGTVYHGHLTDGTQVAVKMLSATSAQGSNQFRTEAHLLMRVHHRNLASFIGYCNEGTNIGIIYEYMACGNLEQYLSDKSIEPLTWKERLQIALDAAQGLEYLHHGCKPPIIHRDVKCANILLNENLQAKVADFGFSKCLPSESRSHMSTAVVGTVGYLDPEYYSSNRLTEKSDVYSFGIVLLELITGQPAIMRNRDENIHIVHWVRPFIERGDIRSAADPRLQGKLDTNSAWKFMEIAMSCVPPIMIHRPTMNHVVAELKECLGTEIAREQNCRMEGQAMRLSNSFEMIAVDLETEMGPEAR